MILLCQPLNLFNAINSLQKSIAISKEIFNKDSKILKIRQAKLKKYIQELNQKSKQIKSLFDKKDNYQTLLKISTVYSNRSNARYNNILYYTLTNDFSRKEKMNFFNDMLSFFSEKYTEVGYKKGTREYDYTNYRIYEKASRLLSLVMRYKDKDLIKLWLKEYDKNNVSEKLKSRYRYNLLKLLDRVFFIENKEIIKRLIKGIKYKDNIKQKSSEYLYYRYLFHAARIKSTKIRKKITDILYKQLSLATMKRGEKKTLEIEKLKAEKKRILKIGKNPSYRYYDDVPKCIRGINNLKINNKKVNDLLWQMLKSKEYQKYVDKKYNKVWNFKEQILSTLANFQAKPKQVIPYIINSMTNKYNRALRDMLEGDSDRLKKRENSYEEIAIPYLFKGLENKNIGIAKECLDILTYSVNKWRGKYDNEKRVLILKKKLAKLRKQSQEKKNKFLTELQSLESISKDRPLSSPATFMKFIEIKPLEKLPLYYTLHIEHPASYHGSRQEEIIIWRKIKEDKYKNIKKIDLYDDSRFQEATLIKYKKKYFFYIKIRQTGTGGFNASEFYHLSRENEEFTFYKVKMDTDKIIKIISKHLDKNQYIQWQIGCNQFSDNNLSFGYYTYIDYKNDNGNITGKYFLQELKENSL